MPLQDFLKSRTSIHNKSSLPSAWQVISWGLGKIGFAGKAHSVSKDLVPIGVLQVGQTIHLATIANQGIG